MIREAMRTPKKGRREKGASYVTLHTALLLLVPMMRAAAGRWSEWDRSINPHGHLGATKARPSARSKVRQ